MNGKNAPEAVTDAYAIGPRRDQVRRDRFQTQTPYASFKVSVSLPNTEGCPVKGLRYCWAKAAQ